MYLLSPATSAALPSSALTPPMDADLAETLLTIWGSLLFFLQPPDLHPCYFLFSEHTFRLSSLILTHPCFPVQVVIFLFSPRYVTESYYLSVDSVLRNGCVREMLPFPRLCPGFSLSYIEIMRVVKRLRCEGVDYLAWMLAEKPSVTRVY